jgi:hypothetical protein
MLLVTAAGHVYKPDRSWHNILVDEAVSDTRQGSEIGVRHRNLNHHHTG